MSELNIGQPYIVKGQGELLLEAVEGEVLTFLTHGNTRRWHYVTDVLRQATPADIATRHMQAQARGVDCNSPGCWCVQFLVLAKENKQ